MTSRPFAGSAFVRRRLTVLVLLAAVIGGGHLHGQTNEWTGFLSWSSGRTIIPEDSKMGPLANLRQPDPVWASALELCSRALDVLGRGEVPAEYLHPSVRTLISLEMADALFNSSVGTWSARYGLPLRDGSRLTVPLRLSSGSLVNYGYIYLIYEGSWFIEQWAVDITFPPATAEDSDSQD